MNKIRLLILILILGLTARSQDSEFSPVDPTGLPYSIIIQGLNLNGDPCPIGTEVGVFADTLCVGSAYFQGEMDLQLISWQGDVSQSLPGFTPGDSIEFKLRIPWNEEIILRDASSEFIQGDGSFGNGTFSVVYLEVIDSSLYTGLAYREIMPIHIFPNPCTSQIHIQSENSDLSLIRIYSVLGTLLGEYAFGSGLSPDHEIQIPVDHLPSGQYCMQFLSTEGGELVSKLFIKQ